MAGKRSIQDPFSSHPLEKSFAYRKNMSYLLEENGKEQHLGHGARARAEMLKPTPTMKTGFLPLYLLKIQKRDGMTERRRNVLCYIIPASKK
jgi:hypothetical protein